MELWMFRKVKATNIIHHWFDLNHLSWPFMISQWLEIDLKWPYFDRKWPWVYKILRMQLNGFHSILIIQNGILFDIRIGRFSPLDWGQAIREGCSNVGEGCWWRMFFHQYTASPTFKSSSSTYLFHQHPYFRKWPLWDWNWSK